MPLVVSVIQQKGGVGKTTIATSLFAHLVSEGVSTGIIDLDPQGNATAWAIGHGGFLSIRQHCGAEAFTLPYGEIAKSVSRGSAPGEAVHDHVLPCVKLGGGFVVPANPYMAVHNFTSFTPDALPFDVAIVDTPPHLASTIFRQLACCSHAVIAPVQPEPHAVQNIPDLIGELAVGGQHLLDTNALRLVVTMRQKCANHEAYEKYLRQNFKQYVSPVVISRATAWGEMAAFERPWKRTGVVAKAAAELWADIETTLSNARVAA